MESDQKIKKWERDYNEIVEKYIKSEKMVWKLRG